MPRDWNYEFQHHREHPFPYEKFIQTTKLGEKSYSMIIEALKRRLGATKQMKKYSSAKFALL